MKLSPGYTKLSARDVEDLNTASDCIASAANTIQTLHPQWGAAVVALLVQANDICVRIQNRGAGAIARYIEKHSVPSVPVPVEVERAGTETGQEQSIEREEG